MQQYAILSILFMQIAQMEFPQEAGLEGRHEQGRGFPGGGSDHRGGGEG